MEDLKERKWYSVMQVIYRWVPLLTIRPKNIILEKYCCALQNSKSSGRFGVVVNSLCSGEEQLAARQEHSRKPLPLHDTAVIQLSFVVPRGRWYDRPSRRRELTSENPRPICFNCVLS